MIRRRTIQGLLTVKTFEAKRSENIEVNPPPCPKRTERGERKGREVCRYQADFPFPFHERKSACPRNLDEKEAQTEKKLLLLIGSPIPK